MVLLTRSLRAKFLILFALIPMLDLSQHVVVLWLQLRAAVRLAPNEGADNGWKQTRSRSPAPR